MPTLDWIGKNAVIDHHRKVPYHLLRCDPKISVGDVDAGNLLVQGDNLLALKALLPYYAGKVKCIYIDPPYNTSNEGWVYNDNVNSPEIKKWLAQVVGKEGEDLSRHDKWLCMMYPSGTTAHAVLAQNAADGGNRKFILVEMDESICQNVTAQRIGKAIGGYGDGKNAVPGLGGGFRYCKLGAGLFDELGNISSEVRFADLAAHVYFTETGGPLPKKSNGKSPLLGVHQGRAVYLLYNGILGDRRPDGGNVLTHEVASELPPHTGPRIVYGEACRLGQKSLDSYGIAFKQIPFELKVD